MKKYGPDQIKKCLWLLVLLIFLIALAGCSPSAKSEKEIVDDLQENSAFFSTGGELTITGYDVTKRRTDADNFADIVYLDIYAENDDIDCILSYIMHYELYNDGWILESVERDYEGQWSIVPLHGMTDTELQEKLDYYISEGRYDTIEVAERETDLTEYGCEETVYLLATKEHLYGTETFQVVQTWYFEPSICRFTSIVAAPFITERSIALKDPIVGVSWNCSRYHNQMNVWPDKFDFAILDLYEENGKTWMELSVDRERNTYWDYNSNEPVYWGCKSTFAVSLYLTYLEEEGMWAYNLQDLNEYLYSEDDNERFTENSWFCFSLDQGGGGYIIDTSG